MAWDPAAAFDAVDLFWDQPRPLGLPCRIVCSLVEGDGGMDKALLHEVAHFDGQCRLVRTVFHDDAGAPYLEHRIEYSDSGVDKWILNLEEQSRKCWRHAAGPVDDSVIVFLADEGHPHEVYQEYHLDAQGRVTTCIEPDPSGETGQVWSARYSDNDRRRSVDCSVPPAGPTCHFDYQVSDDNCSLRISISGRHIDGTNIMEYSDTLDAAGNWICRKEYRYAIGAGSSQPLGRGSDVAPDRTYFREIHYGPASIAESDLWASELAPVVKFSPEPGEHLMVGQT